jgi:transposase
MTRTDRDRLDVLHRLDRAEMDAKHAAALLQVSTRQARRILASFRLRGDSAAIHGNRGRRPSNRLDDAVRARAVELLNTPAGDGENNLGLNDCHIQDLLEDEGSAVSAATVRRIRLSIGRPPASQRRQKRHRKRARKSRAGMLIQLDATTHYWLGPNRPQFDLVVGIDDATNEVFAVFRPTEDCLGYLLLMAQIVRKRGLPDAVYTDRHTILVPQTKEDKENGATQFGRSMQRLGIRMIAAHSPQAKGRVERAHKTLHDRLAKELQLNNITTMDDANAYLAKFLRRHNLRFMVQPEEPEGAWREPQSEAWINDCIAMDFTRTVKKDHTISLACACLVIPGNSSQSLAGRPVSVRIHLDRSVSFWHKDKRLGRGPRLTREPTPDTRKLKEIMPSTAPITKKPEPIRTQKPRREPTGYRPPADHPWRKRFPRPRPVIPSLTTGGG